MTGAIGLDPTVRAPDFPATQEASSDCFEDNEACQNCRAGEHGAGRYQLDGSVRVALRAGVDGASRRPADNDGSRDIYDHRHDDGHADSHLHLPGDADGHADHRDAAADHACADGDADRAGGRADASGGNRLPSSNGLTCR